ncbi:coenzyme F420 hydrogenase/dehydrogenase subunit beta [Methanocaldococcus villosus KIN24-T80]|uniref:Coenzyme F420 hydrogenase/dehydrogenase subunit beta n=1 Tax=Methanocaldococcus villosus KIN24-T80 TaxID=1069083 RepID=N6VRB7_9EURY|nr:Coenzyme F420 hydrogenase/dehydrogenase, beta subunit C-terminal domain [Methanocaldococcus villosus]ENN95701.1 coenzyme F420 hydrogenase/dehydrogenase subunit beta [Methanocaldococcus villosus KIN24-T80]
MKSYKDLKAEVWDKNRCSGCGACVAVCPVNNLYFKEESPVKFICDECSCMIVPAKTEEHPLSAEFCKTVNYDVPCGACYDACPRIRELAINDPLGKYLKILKAKASTEIKYAQNGGVVTAILANAFEEELIDGAIVMKEDRWTLEPQSFLAMSKEDVLKSAGSKYLRKGNVLQAFKKAVMEEKLKKLAIVGTPCVISAICNILSSDNDLLGPFRRAIRLKISLFCFEIFDYNKMIDLLEKEGINPWDIKKMDILTGKLRITFVSGEYKDYNLKELEFAVREGCKCCGDFTGVCSDISVGNIGSGEGYSTVIIRNNWGEGFFLRAAHNGYLSYDDKVNVEEIVKLARLKMKRIKK